ncbi:MAG: hypothetical protein AAGF53_10800 [Pseudomonadota bacterium]
MKFAHEPRFTSEIYARRFLDLGPDETVVSWAENMALAGFTSDGLFILLGESKPFNKFEIDGLLDRIQRELKIPKVTSQKEAVEIIATAHVRRFLSGEAESVSTLFALKELYDNEGREDALFDFYLLHFAAEDLETDKVQHYWPGANNENIKKIICEVFSTWIDEHVLMAWKAYEWKSV